jgi:hypothetical protein
MCPDNAAPGNSAGARCVWGGGGGRGGGRLLSNKQEPLVTPVSLSPRLLLRCVSGGGSIQISL